MTSTLDSHIVDAKDASGKICPLKEHRSECWGHLCMAWRWYDDKRGYCGLVGASRIDTVLKG